MKNIETLYTPEEITEKLNGLWKTDLFKREASRPGSMVNRVVNRAAQYPIFFYDMSDSPSTDTPDNEKTEWAHHMAWMGGIPRRAYSNPAIADLAMLHELYHKGMMSYSPGMSHDAFKRKMFDNELEASVTSELEIYFQHPEFRENTFSQEIFADRFLRDNEFMQRWNNDPERMRGIVREQRRDAMHQVANPKDTVQYWINKFADQNEQWALTWRERYNQLETAMANLHRTIDLGGNRQQAMDEYMAWLSSPEITKGTEIPFPDEAHAFAGVARFNKRLYQESIKRGEMASPTSAEASNGPGLRSRIEQAIQGIDWGTALPELIRQCGPLSEQQLRNIVAQQVPRATWAPEDFQSVIHRDKTCHAGAFAWGYYEDNTRRDPNTHRMGEVMVVLSRRGKETTEDGLPMYGASGGGYRELGSNHTAGEQPDENAVRELNEETRDDMNKPVLDIAPARLTHVLKVGTDYRKPQLPVDYVGYALTLSAEEYQAIKQHGERLATDEAYKAKVFKHTNGEVSGYEVMPLSQALQMKPEQFAHPHECEALQKLAQLLSERALQHANAR